MTRFRPGLWSPKLESYLAELYVVPDRRGQGIGRALMEETMAAARAEGADTMELGTGEADVSARGLYESLGFTHTEHGPGGVETLELLLRARAVAGVRPRGSGPGVSRATAR